MRHLCSCRGRARRTRNDQFALARERFWARADDRIHQYRQESPQHNDDKIPGRPWIHCRCDGRRSLHTPGAQHPRRGKCRRSVTHYGCVGERLAAQTHSSADYSGHWSMTRLSLAGAFSAVVLAAGCARPEQSAADTETASSTAAQAATVAVDTLTTRTESTRSVSTVTRTSSGKKSPGSAARKTGPISSVRSADSAARD